MGAGKGKSRRVATSTAIAETNSVVEQDAAETKRRARVPFDWSFDIDHPIDLNTRELNYDYVTTPAQLRECVAALKNATRIGFDIETTGFASQWGCIRLMQFGIEEPEPRQFVVDCFAVNPESVVKILEDPKKETIIHNSWFEQNWLLFHYGTHIGRIFDTCIASRKLNYSAARTTKKTRSRLKDVVRRYTGKQMDKSQQVSYWDLKELDDKQIRYAANDVATLLDVRNPLKKDVVEKGVTKEVETDTNKIFYAVRGKLRKLDEPREDELIRAHRAVVAATSIAELRRAHDRTRQLVLTYENRDKVKEMVRTRTEELRAEKAGADLISA